MRSAFTGAATRRTIKSAVINAARDDLVQAIQTVGTKFDVNDYVDMPEGRAYVHQSWSGDLVSVQYYYPSWSQRDMIRYWYPPDGKGAIGSDTIAILTGTVSEQGVIEANEMLTKCPSKYETKSDAATIDPNLLLPLSVVNHPFTHFAASTIFTNALIFSSSAIAFIRS